MELNISKFFANAAPMDYSASVAEIGRDAGKATWSAACDDAEDWNLLDTDEKREAFREFVGESGGWSEDEIKAWSDKELNALCIQWISGDMREVPDVEMGPDMTDDDWESVSAMQRDGVISSRIFRADDGQVYFDLS